MKALIIVLLAFSMVGESEEFLGIFEDILVGILGIFKVFVNVFAKIIGTGINIGGNIIGVVVDPFKTWTSGDDHGHKDGEVDKCSVIADILFVLDSSGSMSKDDFISEITFARRLVEHYNVNAKETKFAAITFSDTALKVFGFSDSTAGNLVDLYLQTAKYLGAGTNTAGALNAILAAGLFTTQAGARAVSSKIVVVVTDGQSNNPAATAQAAALLKSRGIHIIAVGVGTLWGINNELYNIASGSSNVYTADFFSSLNKIEQRVALKTCQISINDGNVLRPQSGCKNGFKNNPSNPDTCIDVNECLGSNKCQQVCDNLPGSYRCSCNSGYVIDTNDPTSCKPSKSCTAPVDVVFAIDASASIGPENFRNLAYFLAKLTLQFNFGPRGAQWGAVLFGSKVIPLFQLNTYSVRANISAALTSAPYPADRSTLTNQALDFIVNNTLFDPANGGRVAAPDVVVLVTDGQSSNPDITLASAARLKQQNVKIVAVGITNLVSTEELAAVATKSETDVILISDWDLLDYAEKNVAEAACPQKLYT